jgi:tRNA-2-methylthio-N6-dimethylallyladenosine synthase
MNERDSEAIACELEAAGMAPASCEKEADVLLFNTCSVRDLAENKAIGKVGTLKKLKRQRPGVVLGLMGCMAQNKGKGLLDQLPHLDLVIGTENLHLVTEAVARALSGDGPVVLTDANDDVLTNLKTHAAGKLSSYVAVMRGCNQFCSYCIVPHVRGREKSRPIQEIVDEARALTDQGVKEIFLLGQNITAYGVAELRNSGEYTGEESPFADLLYALNELEGVERIRFTSPHPRFMNQRFVDAFTNCSKVCESIHVPMQSGSDEILKQMRRGYTSTDYRQVIRAIREGCPEVAFSTDVIVGFPGETEADFEATRDLFTETGFDMAYIFKYSTRPGTKAAEWHDNVPQEIKEARNQILLEDLKASAESRNESMIGKSVDLLVEGPSKRNTERWSGRTRQNRVAVFSPCPNVQRGDIVNAKVTSVTASTLYCDLAE